MYSYHHLSTDGIAPPIAIQKQTTNNPLLALTKGYRTESQLRYLLTLKNWPWPYFRPDQKFDTLFQTFLIVSSLCSSDQCWRQCLCTYHLLLSESTPGTPPGNPWEPRGNGTVLVFLFPSRGGKLFSFGNDLACPQGHTHEIFRVLVSRISI